MSWQMQVSLSYWFNSNAGLATTKGVRELREGRARLARKRQLSSFYVGIGPSSSFEVAKSEYVRSKYPYLAQSQVGDFFPDLTAGYHLHRPDLNMGLSYRRMRSEVSGYGVTHQYDRRSLMLEVYKFLGDYHSFVPYVGPTLSYEALQFTQTDGPVGQGLGQRKLAIGIIAGWDVRLTNAESFLLRTNLRYAPGLHMQTANGSRIRFDYLEFNFIQAVFYPGRLAALRR